MYSTRRDLLTTGGALLAAAGLAGCNAPTGDGSTEPSPGTTPASAGAASAADLAVAAEWNAMRARLRDSLSLGLSGEAGDGAPVAGDVFARFEAAGGDNGAHEVLESTSEANYEEFEEALGELRTAGLEAGDIGRAREETTIASNQLAEAQRALAGEETGRALDLQLSGVAAFDAAFLGAAGRFAAAGEVASDVLARFEASGAHDALESADPDSYEAFEGALEAAVSGAENEDAEAVRTGVRDAYDAAIEGSYALAGTEAAAGAGHVATLQARGWDAAALARMGGPSTAYAHAAALSVYRTRVHDCAWLAARGETGRAATMAGDVFAHFEGARAHEALEGADHDAYEGLEGGLADLRSAIEGGDAAGVDEAVSAVDSNLVAGISALAGTDAPLLGSAFFRARLADARERYRFGGADAAASLAEGLFGRFERNELDLHETVESTSEELYHRFEEEHLAGLVDAFERGDDSGVETHYEGAQAALLEFETAAGSTAAVGGAEGAYVAARGFDAAVLDALGDDERAAAIARGAFEHFETGAGGYHEALESADESTYDAFEGALGGVATAADEGEDVYPAATRFDAEVLNSVYAIVGSAGGSHLGAAAGVVQDVFAGFEEARVHELLEAADRDAYDGFEAALADYAGALEDGSDVDAAAETFATASLRAQFAVAGAPDAAPAGGTRTGGGDDGETSLQGGPNVVESVPEEADHVVALAAVSFEPAELTVGKGDTVAWEHAAGEPHTVTAYAEELPDGAAYWASGGFEDEAAAREGWEDGRGAVQPGQSYVRTFETVGEHAYFCVPHEAAGMTGTVVVE